MSSIKIEVKVETRTGFLRGDRSFLAILGNVEARGATDTAARHTLAKDVASICAEIASPTVMWDLVEPATVWIAYPSAFGWAYSITRHQPREASLHNASACQIGSGWTRDECLDRMKKHWYDNNVRPIVEGIVGLCTDRRRFECAKCRSMSVAGAPYACSNPSCGRVAGGERAA